MRYNNLKVQDYIVNSIEFTEDEQANKQDILWKLHAIYNQFKMEVLKNDYRYKRTDLLRPINEKRIFMEWLQGLPTNINIEFRGFEQVELLEEWGVELNNNMNEFELFYNIVTDEFYRMILQ